MGGYGSGRRKQHARTDDCLMLDTAWLRKEKLLSGQAKRRFKIGWVQHTVIDFHEPKERQHKIGAQVVLYGDQGGEFTCWDASGQVNLFYQAEIQPDTYHSQQEHNYSLSLPLVTTSPNYGGVRWWFLAPCCGQRVRVVYLPTQGEIASITPQCRNCLELHYPSQCASYIERQKTYERHLLANYGLHWAAWRYDFELKEHYLKMTPALEELRQRSIIDHHLHFLKLLIRCEQTLLRSHLRNLRNLRSEEDKRIYLDHMRQQEQESGLDWVKLLGYGIELERAALDASPATTARNDAVASALENGEQVESESPAPEEAIETKLRFLNRAHKQVTDEGKKLALAA